MSDKFGFAVFCDDLRQERSGKWLLIGCYGESVKVDRFPAPMSLAAYIYVDSHGILAGDTVRFELSLSSGAILSQMAGKIKEIKKRDDYAYIAVPKSQFVLSSPDVINLYIIVKDEKRLVQSIEVLKGEAEQATAV